MTDTSTHNEDEGQVSSALGMKDGESEQAYNDRMAAKFRAQLDGQVEPLDGEQSGEGDETPPAPKATRPEHVPEKFWDAEKGEIRLDALLKSNAELEKKLSQKPAAPKAPASGETANGENGDEGQPNGENGEGTPDPYAAGVQAFAALREQATATLAAGEQLSEEQYAGFEKHGLGRADVDAFIAGQEAIGQLARMQVFDAVGGEDAYGKMIAWAKTNFEASEIEVYDRDIHSADPAVRLTAARGLSARYAQAMGTSGKSVTEVGASKGSEGYASGAEMRADMRDPRYREDEAFRQKVARKVAAARQAGVDLSI